MQFVSVSYSNFNLNQLLYLVYKNRVLNGKFLGGTNKSIRSVSKIGISKIHCEKSNMALQFDSWFGHFSFKSLQIQMKNVK